VHPAEQLLKNLHWLPKYKCIELKHAMLYNTAINQGQLVYLSDQVIPTKAAGFTHQP